MNPPVVAVVVRAPVLADQSAVGGVFGPIVRPAGELVRQPDKILGVELHILDMHNPAFPDAVFNRGVNCECFLCVSHGTPPPLPALGISQGTAGIGGTALLCECRFPRPHPTSPPGVAQATRDPR